MANLTQKIRSTLCASAATLCIGGFLTAGQGLAQEAASYDLSELQTLNRAASLLERQDYERAQDAYKKLADAIGTSPQVREAALEGFAFAKAADLRLQVADAQNDSRNLFVVRVNRRNLLAEMAKLTPQVDTQIMAYIQAVMAQEGDLTLATFSGHAFEDAFARIEDHGAALPEQPPIAIVTPQATRPAAPDNTSLNASFAGTYVATRVANIRDLPTQQGSSVTGRLTAGEKVRVNARVAGSDGANWYQLDEDRSFGYVHSSLLVTEAQAQAQAARETTRLPQTTDTTDEGPKREAAAPAPKPAPTAKAGACSGSNFTTYRVAKSARIYDAPGGNLVATLNAQRLVRVLRAEGRYLVVQLNNQCRYLDNGSDPSKPAAYPI